MIICDIRVLLHSRVGRGVVLLYRRVNWAGRIWVARRHRRWYRAWRGAKSWLPDLSCPVQAVDREALEQGRPGSCVHTECLKCIICSVRDCPGIANDDGVEIHCAPSLWHRVEPSKGHALKRNRRSVVAPYELGGQLTLSRQIQNNLGPACTSAWCTCGGSTRFRPAWASREQSRPRPTGPASIMHASVLRGETVRPDTWTVRRSARTSKRLVRAAEHLDPRGSLPLP